MRLRNRAFLAFLGCVLALGLALNAGAQVNTVNLSGTVLDPQGLAVNGAKVTLVSLATGAQRGATSGSNGGYEIVGLPPGKYSLTVEAPGFATLKNPSITLTLGQTAEYNPQLQLKTTTETVSVSAAPDLVDTSKADVSATVTSLQIDNLPINERNYINFTLLDSQAARDDTPSIGAAPTSGLNFGGQRGRSNEVSVDGADAVDKSVGGVRATVSQEAVQEFQVITSNYMPEYGRATGGVVNIVTKSGSNQFHGNAFGFLRNEAIQAQNPFSVRGAFDPATETVNLNPVKQSFTRVQAGATLGGPIQKDKTFFFFAYETIRAQATGFTSIGQNNFGLESLPTPNVCFPGQTNSLVTPQQAAILAVAPQYFCLAALASQTALLGNTPALLWTPLNSFAEDQMACGGPCTVPVGFQGLVSLLGNFPTKEQTSLWSMKLDHIWNSTNSSFLRANVSPSLITGIEVNAQNQNFGQNAGNRTSDQQTRDIDAVFQHTTAFKNNFFNEFRFQYARRGLHYGFSDLPGGSAAAVNLTGAAFFGREPFSTEDRIERRFEITDNLTWTKGRHTFKFGGDTNLVHVNTGAAQIFTLNYGGVYTFTGLDAATINPAFAGLPGLNSVQAYGLGLPSTFFQGIGNTNFPSDDKSLGVFAQDSWKINRRVTLNYGVRYDVEWAPIFPAATPINAAAEHALGVIQGIPMNSKNVQPRVALAWDPWGDGKTVIRAGYGIFYDNPSIALAFLANTFDGAESTLLLAAGGTPCVLPMTGGCDVDTNVQALNATNIFQGLLTGNLAGCVPSNVPLMCYQSAQQRFNPFQPNSLFTAQNFLSFPPAPNPIPATGPFGAGYPLVLLPFTIPVQRNFKYGYAQQANLTFERELTKDLKLSVGYNYTHGTHLDRTINTNVTDPGLLIGNDANAITIGLQPPGSSPLFVTVPQGAVNSCASTASGSILLIAPGILGEGFTSGNCTTGPVGFIGTPAVFNFFRPSGPNPSFAALVPGGYATLVGLAHAGGFPTGPGVPIPWSDVQPQTSTGNSIYNALTVTVTKRFSNHFELLSGWTWSHTIDDSTDLSTLLNPQDNSNPNGDRGNSDFDQRHRWITSAVFQSPYSTSDQGAWRKLLADFTIAPIIEVSSGRPYNILIGSDPNLDLGTSTGRPDVFPRGQVPAGLPVIQSPFVSGADFTIPTVCLNSALQPIPFNVNTLTPPVGCTGTLGRNFYNRPGFFQIDLRIERKIRLGERMNLDIIADGFNMLNRFNVSDVNPFCDTTVPGATTCAAGQPTAVFDPRTFQFALKLNF